jgi:RNA polymerase sigma factor (sigma-70 family)
MEPTVSEPSLVEALLAHGSWAVRLARHLVGSDADDLVQEGWIAAWLARPAERGGLRPWLARVLRRAAANRRRGEQRRQARHQAAADVTSDGVASPEDLTARMELQRLLADLLLALSPPVREVVLLRFYQGHTSAEIARALGVPEGTVRWRLKMGLDELRRQLEDRHRGGANRWELALSPLLGEARAPLDGTTPKPIPAPRATLLSAGSLVMTVGLLLLAGAGVWLTWRPGATGAERPVTENRAGGKTPGSLGTKPDGPARRAAAAGGALTDDQCARRLAAVQAQLAATEPQFIVAARGPKVFELGQPNPAAEGALGPPLAKLMKGDADRAPDYTLECRTWVCRMRVLQPDGINANAWMGPLQRDPAMRERTRGMGFESGPPVKDPVSGATFEEIPVYLKLADPSGKPVPGPHPERWRPVAPIAAAPVAPGRCHAELAAAERRLATMKDAIERDMPPRERWERGVPNLALTSQFDGVVRRSFSLPPDSSAVTAECRDQVCRLQMDRQRFPDPNTHKQLREAPELRGRIEGAMVGSWDNYFVLAPSGATVGMDIVKAIVAELLASPALAACEHRHTPTGRIVAQLQLPRTGDINQDGQEARISVRIGGPLADTPFARCFEAVLAPIVERTAIPSMVTGATLTKRLDFPREPPATKLAP